MASWMIHLRIADKLLDRLANIEITEFIMGNIAPDSGVPNEDWSVFTPSGDYTNQEFSFWGITRICLRILSG